MRCGAVAKAVVDVRLETHGKGIPTEPKMLPTQGWWRRLLPAQALIDCCRIHCGLLCGLALA